MVEARAGDDVSSGVAVRVLSGNRERSGIEPLRAVCGPAFGLPIRLGRSRLLPLTRPMGETSCPAAEERFTVKGAPLCAVRMPDTFQPPSSRCATPGAVACERQRVDRVGD